MISFNCKQKAILRCDGWFKVQTATIRLFLSCGPEVQTSMRKLLPSSSAVSGTNRIFYSEDGGCRLLRTQLQVVVRQNPLILLCIRLTHPYQFSH